ncbi:hypothetical protein HVA01_10300 [Halovibrio variabilis]|uniref:Transposase n=1 Tax=Halovibrio variabilis TaxID=31910 RepID=A0A511UL89_9GAMM|nr:hypothetical protein HVA01_10300 [Halovibrio variabilis]
MEFSLNEHKKAISRGIQARRDQPADAARSLGINTNMIGRWIKKHAKDGGQVFGGNQKLISEQTGIRRLREETAGQRWREYYNPDFS